MALVTLGNPTTTSQIDLDNDVIQLTEGSQFSATSTLYTFVDNDNSKILIDGTALMSGSGFVPAMDSEYARIPSRSATARRSRYSSRASCRATP